MKIACLQFAPALGRVEENIKRADAVLSESGIGPGDVEILVLPELAFTGYNFPSLEAIAPYLELTAAGPSTQWAARTALRLNCIVVVGYPEVAASAPSQLHPAPGPGVAIAPQPAETQSTTATGTPVIPSTDPAFPWNYNASVAVSPSGEVVAHYRKTFLYYTDATWARSGSGFWSGVLGLPSGKQGVPPESADIKCAIGICMDLNPHNFTSPWAAFEFGTHVVAVDAELVVVNMAWLSHELAPGMVQGEQACVPDEQTVGYWLERFRPLLGVMDGKTRVLVMANRCGVEGEVCYAGTSCVMGVRDGQVWIWDMCGRGEERVCVVDTEQAPKYVLKMGRQRDEDVNEESEHAK